MPWRRRARAKLQFGLELPLAGTEADLRGGSAYGSFTFTLFINSWSFFFISACEWEPGWST